MRSHACEDGIKRIADALKTTKIKIISKLDFPKLLKNNRIKTTAIIKITSNTSLGN